MEHSPDGLSDKQRKQRERIEQSKEQPGLFA
jgi:hypothetical protein